MRQQMPEGICLKIQSAPKFVTFASPQSALLTAPLVPKGRLFYKRGGVGFPAGDGEARTACLKEKGLKRFQCHRAIQMESSLLACIPMIAYTTWFFKPFPCFLTTKNVCARRLVQQYTLNIINARGFYRPPGIFA